MLFLAGVIGGKTRRSAMETVKMSFGEKGGIFFSFLDVVQIVSIVLQIVFWITPIVWQMSIFDEKVQWALNFNPLFYPVRGYRDALMSGKCFWEYGFGWNLYYWLIALAFCLIGMSCFKKLKQHFADVL